MTIEFAFGVPVFVNPGGSIVPGNAQLDASVTMDIARRAEELGYDALWVPDHRASPLPEDLRLG